MSPQFFQVYSTVKKDTLKTSPKAYLLETPPPPWLSPLSMLADKLNMTPEEAERWIVNLIRNARLDAKIDSKLVRLCFRCSTFRQMSFKLLKQA